MILQRILIHVMISSGQKISDLYSEVDCKWGCKDMIYILNLLKQFDRIQNRIIVSKCPHKNFEVRDVDSNNVWYQKLPSFLALVHKSHDCRLNTTILVLLMYKKVVETDNGQKSYHSVSCKGCLHVGNPLSSSYKKIMGKSISSGISFSISGILSCRGLDEIIFLFFGTFVLPKVTNTHLRIILKD